MSVPKPKNDKETFFTSFEQAQAKKIIPFLPGQSAITHPANGGQLPKEAS